MKTLICVLTMGFSIGANAQSLAVNANGGTTGVIGASSQTVGYQIGKQDGNQRVWQKIIQATDPKGYITYHTNNAYTELATGLNHLVNGQWVESKEQIDILPDGTAAATNGQHQAYFPGDIYQGQIELVTPDGLQLYSRPMGLSYFDGTNTVLITELTNSVGQVLGANQVVYPNAFTGFTADLLYTYTKAGFEQDVILRQQPPTPKSLGLNPDSARLQILTEFFSPPQPAIQSTALPLQAGVSLTDESLGFGAMRMIQGRAFLMGQSANDVGAMVSKHWLLVNGRQFLVEEVPVNAIVEGLAALPLTAMNSGSGKTSHTASRHLTLPPQWLVKNHTAKPMMLAKATLPAPGFVLDYQTVNGSQTSYTFRGDTTYYISGSVTLNGTGTFEGGAVLKYTNGASITLSPLAALNWQASSYRPVIFTAKDDNSVGQGISGSTGNPTNYYASCALKIYGISGTLANLRVAYARQALYFYSSSSSIYNAQFINCWFGVGFGAGTINLRNALFANVKTNFNLDGSGGAAINVQNTTISGSTYLLTGSASPSGTTLVLTNCILANVANLTNGTLTLSGSYNGYYSSPTFEPSPIIVYSPPFQTVGAGDYYLQTDGYGDDLSGFRGNGTVNIDPVLLSSLAQQTTWPPLLLTNQDLSSYGFLSRQATRDTTSPGPDLGYHYDPIDYLVDNCSVSNVTLSALGGTAVACGNEPGIQLQNGSTMVSIGTPVTPNWFVRYQSVQEQSVPLGGTNIGGGIAILPAYTSAKPNGQYQFTKFACPAGGGVHLYDYNASSYSNLTVQECEFWGGTNTLGGTNGTTLTLDNNLFARSVIAATGNGTLAFSNNLVWGTTWAQLNPAGGSVWRAFNNDFDSSTITNSTLTNGYNAYLNCNGYLTPTNATDIFSTSALGYQTGPLGTFYQPAGSLLVDKGSTTAAGAGLADYTTQTNETPDSGTVDIGYHYYVYCPSGETQFWVDSSPTAAELAQWLVGNNVTITNVTYNGATVARGIFGGGGSVGFPIDSGVILSSGHITNAIGPNNDSGFTASGNGSSDLGEPGDSDLDNLTDGGPTQDAAVLEFDINSTNSFTLQFQYVFCSEEYPEWINPYNDPMAIFVSTNRVGTNWINSITNDIALVPGTTNVPVSVNNINGGYTNYSGYGVSPTNPQYYIDNHDPSYSAVSPYTAATPVYNLQYDGFTTVLTAQAYISAGVVNHVKIAISDYGYFDGKPDHVLDSAIFIKTQTLCP